MGLDPQTTVIGYKISSDRVRDAPQEISSEQDYTLAMESILTKVRGARTKTYTLILHNLVSFWLVSYLQIGSNLASIQIGSQLAPSGLKPAQMPSCRKCTPKSCGINFSANVMADTAFEGV